MPNRPALPCLLPLAFAALLATGARAETTIPSATSATTGTTDDSALRQAQARLQSDQALCMKETTPRARLQCRREAMADYDKAVADAKPRGGATPAVAASAASAPASAASAAPTACPDCGRVVAVREMTAPNGSFAGRALERRMGARKGWVVDVQYDQQGDVMHYVFPQAPGFKVGDKVRPEGSGIARP